MYVLKNEFLLKWSLVQPLNDLTQRANEDVHPVGPPHTLRYGTN